jgi:hypothetical protein
MAAGQSVGESATDDAPEPSIDIRDVATLDVLSTATGDGRDACGKSRELM